ncbi:hypothetical protein [Halobaculum roseum]|uniref:Uncharacterized protein n=1 Tax=Halobaculum roseum TaxID=2175149 RepID=A0ABD5MNA6_9EURY|nr:hypothetical protein [Halobaculum roseum]QZY01633.1 hypothetical protein K6T36_09825 [Halobaculum roseum]
MSLATLSPRVLRLVAVALVASALVAAAVPADGAARAPPEPACGVCVDGALADAADRHGVAVAVERATLDVHVSDDGSTRWTARLDLSDGTDALRNDSLRAAIVDAATASDGGDRTSRMDGDTLVVEHRRGDAAEREAGAVLFTAFDARDPVLPFVMGGEGTVYPGADALVLHAPEGHVVAGGVGDGTVEGRTVVWRGAEGGDDGIDRDAVPTFVPEGAVAPGVRGVLARLLAGY